MTELRQCWRCGRILAADRVEEGRIEMSFFRPVVEPNTPKEQPPIPTGEFKRVVEEVRMCVDREACESAFERRYVKEKTA